MAFAEGAAASPSIGDIPVSAKAEQVTNRLDDIARRLRHIQDRIEGIRPQAVPAGADKIAEAPPLRRQLQNLDRQTDDILGLVNSIESTLFG